MSAPILTLPTPQSYPSAEKTIQTQFIGWYDAGRARALILGPALERWILCLHWPGSIADGRTSPSIPDGVPSSIEPARIIPPPVRETRAEADLLLRFGNKVGGMFGTTTASGKSPDAPDDWYWEFAEEYAREASGSKLTDIQIPEPWELVYGECLDCEPRPPRPHMETRDGDIYIDGKSMRGHVVESGPSDEERRAAIKKWKTSSGYCLEQMELDLQSFLGNPPSIGTNDLLTCARIKYRVRMGEHLSAFIRGYDLRPPVTLAEQADFDGAFKQCRELATIPFREARALLQSKVGGNKKIGPEAIEVACTKLGLNSKGPFSPADLERLADCILEKRLRPSVGTANKERRGSAYSDGDAEDAHQLPS